METSELDIITMLIGPSDGRLSTAQHPPSTALITPVEASCPLLFAKDKLKLSQENFESKITAKTATAPCLMLTKQVTRESFLMQLAFQHGFGLTETMDRCLLQLHDLQPSQRALPLLSRQISSCCQQGLSIFYDEFCFLLLF